MTSSPDRRSSASPLPPDPAAYDSERNAAARARGLSAPYIPGGRDPDQELADPEELTANGQRNTISRWVGYERID